MTGADEEVGRAFREHREQRVRRSCLWSKLRRIRDQINRIEKDYDQPDRTVHEVTEAIKTIGKDDGDVIAIFEELADASRKVCDLASELKGHGMGDYLNGK